MAGYTPGSVTLVLSGGMGQKSDNLLSEASGRPPEMLNVSKAMLPNNTCMYISDLNSKWCVSGF